VVFNIAGVLLWVFFIPQFAELVADVSPSYPGLSGTERMAAEVPRQIANAHTMFNVLNTLIFIWFTAPLARLIERLVPERPEPETIIIRPRFLDKELLSAPSLALERARLEMGRLGSILLDMLRLVPVAAAEPDRVDDIRKEEDKVNILYAEIIEYLRRIHNSSLSPEESEEFVLLVGATDTFESIGNVISKDMVPLIEEARDKELGMTDALREIYRGLYAAVADALEATVRAMEKDDQQAAQDVLALKDDVHRMVDKALLLQVGELTGERAVGIEGFRIEMEAVDKFKRLYALCKRIAKGVLPKAVEAAA
jgi:phosphate:Na+ symporter